MNRKEHIAQNIRYLRLSQGLTQDSLAKIAGVSKVQIQRVETLRRGTSIAFLDKLAKALGKSLEELVNDDYVDEDNTE